MRRSLLITRHHTDHILKNYDIPLLFANLGRGHFLWVRACCPRLSQAEVGQRRAEAVRRSVSLSFVCALIRLIARLSLMTGSRLGLVSLQPLGVGHPTRISTLLFQRPTPGQSAKWRRGRDRVGCLINSKRAQVVWWLSPSYGAGGTRVLGISG